jgi:hypothetical protein
LDGSGISAWASGTTASGSGGRSSGTGVNEGRCGGREAATKGSSSKREKNRFDDGLAECEGTRHRTSADWHFRAKTASIVEAVQNRLLSVDTNWSSIMVHVSVVITLVDDDGFVTVPMITITDDVAVTVPVTLSVTLTNCYANRADTNAHLFRSNRHCTENSSDGGDYYGILNHFVLLSLLSSVRAMPRCRDRSGFRSEPGGNKLAQDGAPMLHAQLTIERWSSGGR